MKNVMILASLLAIGYLEAIAQTQSQPLLSEQFNNSLSPTWTISDDVSPRSGPSDWQIINSELHQKSNIWSFDAPAEFIYHLGTHVSAGSTTWQDYSLNAVLRSSDNDGIGLLFRYQDARNYYRILLMNDANNSGSVNSAIQRIQKFVDGEPSTLWQNAVNEAYPTGYFALSVDVRGDSITVYLNGKKLAGVVDSEYQTGKIGLFTYANNGAVFDSVQVTREKVVYQEPDRNILYPVTQNRKPYLQHSTQNGVQIAWRSVEPSVGTVEYGTEKGRYEYTMSEQETRKKHHLTITGLTADTEYFYRVKNNNTVVVEDKRLSTAKATTGNQFSFYVLGDSGTGSDQQHAVTDQLKSDYNKLGADFLIHVGDVHQGRGDDYESIYFEEYQPLIGKIPFFLSMGNHDYITDNGEPFIDNFHPPVDGNSHPEGRYYSHKWGNAFFLNIDSNQDFSPGSPQYQFIKEALESQQHQQAEWTFAYFHHPPYNEYWPPWEGSKQVRKDLVPLFESFGVDAVFNGHVHSYEYAIIDNVHYFITGGGGGNLDTFGRDVETTLVSTGLYHFMRMEINGLRANIKAIDVNGNIIHEVRLNKQQVSTASEDYRAVPEAFALEQNYPNPFNPETTIRYQLSKPAQVKLTIFTLHGEKVKTLVQQRQAAGTHSVRFNGEQLSSGVYMYQLSVGDEKLTKKMILLK